MANLRQRTEEQPAGAAPAGDLARQYMEALRATKRRRLGHRWAWGGPLLLGYGAAVGAAHLAWSLAWPELAAAALLAGGTLAGCVAAIRGSMASRRQVGTTPDRDTAAALVAGYAAFDPRTKRLAGPVLLDALGVLRSAPAGEVDGATLLGLLEAGDPKVVLAALRAIGELAPEGAVEAVARVARSPLTTMPAAGGRHLLRRHWRHAWCRRVWRDADLCLWRLRERGQRPPVPAEGITPVAIDALTARLDSAVHRDRLALGVWLAVAMGVSALYIRNLAVVSQPWPMNEFCGLAVFAIWGSIQLLYRRNADRVACELAATNDPRAVGLLALASMRARARGRRALIPVLADLLPRLRSDSLQGQDARLVEAVARLLRCLELALAALSAVQVANPPNATAILDEAIRRRSYWFEPEPEAIAAALEQGRAALLSRRQRVGDPAAWSAGTADLTWLHDLIGRLMRATQGDRRVRAVARCTVRILLPASFTLLIPGLWGPWQVGGVQMIVVPAVLGLVYGWLNGALKERERVTVALALEREAVARRADVTTVLVTAFPALDRGAREMLAPLLTQSLLHARAKEGFHLDASALYRLMDEPDVEVVLASLAAIGEFAPEGAADVVLGTYRPDWLATRTRSMRSFGWVGRTQIATRIACAADDCLARLRAHGRTPAAPAGPPAEHDAALEETRVRTEALLANLHAGIRRDRFTLGLWVAGCLAGHLLLNRLFGGVPPHGVAHAAHGALLWLVWGSLAFYRKRWTGRATRALERLTDPRAVGVLAEAHACVGGAARRRLMLVLAQLLPQVRYEHFAGQDRRAILAVAGLVTDVGLTFAALTALKEIASPYAASPLQNVEAPAYIANPDSVGLARGLPQRFERAVAECQEAIEANRTRVKQRAQLVRPSVAPENPQDLLRPVSGGGSAADHLLLLRPGEPDEQD